MTDSRYSKLDPEDEMDNAHHDIENPPLHPSTDHICISIPKSYWRGFFWDKEVINIRKDDLSNLFVDLHRTEKELDNRINNSGYVGQVIHDAGALTIALLQIVKVAVNKTKSVPETSTDEFTVAMDAICIAIPMLTSFISKVVNYIKKNAERYKEDTQKCQESIEPRLR